MSLFETAYIKILFQDNVVSNITQIFFEQLNIKHILILFYYFVLNPSVQFLFANSLKLSNHAVVKNDTMNMTCGGHSAYKIMWSYWPVGGFPADSVDIRRQGNTLFQNRFSIFDSDGISKLVVSKVTLSDAGTYECTILHAMEDKELLDETKSHAQLLVLGKLCSLYYHVNSKQLFRNR